MDQLANRPMLRSKDGTTDVLKKEDVQELKRVPLKLPPQTDPMGNNGPYLGIQLRGTEVIFDLSPSIQGFYNPNFGLFSNPRLEPVNPWGTHYVSLPLN